MAVGDRDGPRRAARRLRPGHPRRYSFRQRPSPKRENGPRGGSRSRSSRPRPSSSRNRSCCGLSCSARRSPGTPNAKTAARFAYASQSRFSPGRSAGAASLIARTISPRRWPVMRIRTAISASIRDGWTCPPGRHRAAHRRPQGRLGHRQGPVGRLRRQSRHAPPQTADPQSLASLRRSRRPGARRLARALDPSRAPCRPRPFRPPRPLFVAATGAALAHPHLTQARSSGWRRWG